MKHHLAGLNQEMGINASDLNQPAMEIAHL
jgi:hypothetical protein